MDEFFLKEEGRGQGIGKRLLDVVTQWMREQKVIRMIASVYLWNSSAREFYEKEEFLEYALSYEKSISPPQIK